MSFASVSQVSPSPRVLLELAKDLGAFGYAMPSDGNAPLSSISDVPNLPEDTD
jgi:hypothetical protein